MVSASLTRPRMRIPPPGARSRRPCALLGRSRRPTTPGGGIRIHGLGKVPIAVAAYAPPTMKTTIILARSRPCRPSGPANIKRKRRVSGPRRGRLGRKPNRGKTAQDALFAGPVGGPDARAPPWGAEQRAGPDGRCGRRGCQRRAIAAKAAPTKKVGRRLRASYKDRDQTPLCRPSRYAPAKSSRRPAPIASRRPCIRFW